MRDILQTVCVDMDGVLNLYDGWKGEDHPLPEIRPGAKAFLLGLKSRGYRVVVLSARPDRAAKALSDNKMLHMVDLVTNVKPPAHVYIDDRAIRFDGNYVDVLRQVDDFKAHWED